MSQELTLETIFQAINDLGTMFGNELRKVNQKLDILSDRISAVENRLTSLEFKVDSLEKKVNSLEFKFAEFSGKQDKMQEDLDYIKSISHEHHQDIFTLKQKVQKVQQRA